MVSKGTFLILNLIVLFFFIHRFGFTTYSISRITVCILIYIVLYIVTKTIRQNKKVEEKQNK